MINHRSEAALSMRVRAAELARERAAQADGTQHRNNGDEARFRDARYAMSFTKGLEHDDATLLAGSVADGDALRAAMDSGLVDNFNRIDRPAGNKRQWEAPTAGFVHDTQGPDAQEVTMAPAPALGSPELTYEMAEVYELALLHDVPFSAFEDAAGGTNVAIDRAVLRMNDLAHRLRVPAHNFSPRDRKTDGGALTPQTLFRGSSPGVETGGYLSQFMLIGNAFRNYAPQDGKIAYGAQIIDQRVPVAAERDWMVNESDYLTVQRGFHARDNDTLFAMDRSGQFLPTRFITTPRDLATYVHDDALYQAYLNACLILLGQGAPFDPNFDKLSGMGANSDANTGGFALWGGPHILSLVTEVATRGLKAVRFQKFNNHFRLRPEALAARVHKAVVMPEAGGLRDLVQAMRDDLSVPPDEDGTPDLIHEIESHNADQPDGTATALLPMAFQEGSPMHPAYGAGHATVAGACVTILKAYFDTRAVLAARPGTTDLEELKTANIAFRILEPGDQPVAYSLDASGELAPHPVGEADQLTLEGELNKLAANISIGRNMGGVHYFSDYFDSARMGEEIAIGIMEEQALGYGRDPFVMSLRTFDDQDRMIGDPSTVSGEDVLLVSAAAAVRSA